MRYKSSSLNIRVLKCVHSSNAIIKFTNFTDQYSNNRGDNGPAGDNSTEDVRGR